MKNTSFSHILNNANNQNSKLVDKETPRFYFLSAKENIKLEHFKFNSDGHFNSKISILGALNHFVINNY